MSEGKEFVEYNVTGVGSPRVMRAGVFPKAVNTYLPSATAVSKLLGGLLIGEYRLIWLAVGKGGEFNFRWDGIRFMPV